MQDLFEPLTFLKHCQSLGAGGMQANLGTMQRKAVTQLRDFAEQHDLFIDAIVRPPQLENPGISIKLITTRMESMVLSKFMHSKRNRIEWRFSF